MVSELPDDRRKLAEREPEHLQQRLHGPDRLLPVPEKVRSPRPDVTGLWTARTRPGVQRRGQLFSQGKSIQQDQCGLTEDSQRPEFSTIQRVRAGSVGDRGAVAVRTWVLSVKVAVE